MISGEYDELKIMVEGTRAMARQKDPTLVSSDIYLPVSSVSSVSAKPLRYRSHTPKVHNTTTTRLSSRPPRHRSHTPKPIHGSSCRSRSLSLSSSRPKSINQPNDQVGAKTKQQPPRPRPPTPSRPFYTGLPKGTTFDDLRNPNDPIFKPRSRSASAKRSAPGSSCSSIWLGTTPRSQLRGPRLRPGPSPRLYNSVPSKPRPGSQKLKAEAATPEATTQALALSHSISLLPHTPSALAASASCNWDTSTFNSRCQSLTVMSTTRSVYSSAPVDTEADSVYPLLVPPGSTPAELLLETATVHHASLSDSGPVPLQPLSSDMHGKSNSFANFDAPPAALQTLPSHTSPILDTCDAALKNKPVATTGGGWRAWARSFAEAPSKPHSHPRHRPPILKRLLTCASLDGPNTDSFLHMPPVMGQVEHQL